MTGTSDVPGPPTAARAPAGRRGAFGSRSGAAGAHPDPHGPNSGALPLLWEPQTAPRRGPKPALTLDGIARAGIAIADRAGLMAVTMENIARAVAVTKMAIYRYVPGKTELIALMTEIAVGEAPPLAPIPGGWRAQLEAWARTLFDRFLRHPWTLQTTTGTRSIGPNEVGWMEQAVRVLTGTGLRGGEMLDVTATLAGHARAMAEQASAAPGGAPERSMTATIATVLPGREDRFPALTAAIRSAASDGPQDAALDFGLARILDGVQLLIASRA
jgi:AcrR family transcriptional regulator